MFGILGEASMKRNYWVYSITKRFAQRVFSIPYRINTEGKVLFPAQGPVIILPKHQYWTDIPIISLAFEPPLHFVAKKELFYYPVIRSYLLFLGGIPVDRKQTLRTLESFKYLFSLLKAGEKIVIFPEGTYFREGVGPGKSRLLKMILKFQAESKQKIPFVPVGICYGRREGWRRRIEVRIGSPLFAEGESDALSLTERAMEEISYLSQMLRCS